MKRKVFVRLEMFFLFLWWLALMVVISAKLGGPCLIDVHPAKLIVLPAGLTTLFSYLARKEKERQQKDTAEVEGR